MPHAGPSSVASTLTDAPTEVPYKINSKQISDMQLLKNYTVILP
jgi:hypothetical protein